MWGVAHPALDGGGGSGAGGGGCPLAGRAGAGFWGVQTGMRFCGEALQT